MNSETLNKVCTSFVICLKCSSEPIQRFSFDLELKVLGARE